MDDDTPDDRVHTAALRGAVPGSPPRRETAGERATVEAIASDDVRASSTSWYRPGNMVRGGRRRRRPRAPSSTGRGARFAGTRREASDRYGVAPEQSSRSLSVSRREHRAGPRGARLAGRPRATIPTAKPLDVVNHVPRRRHVEPAVPGDPRAAGPGLRGVLVAVALRRRRRAHCVCRHRRPITSMRCSTLVEPRSSTWRRRGHRRRARGGHRLLDRFVCAGPRRSLEPHGPTRRTSDVVRRGSLDRRPTRAYRAVTGDAVGAVAKRLLTGDVALAALGPVHRKVLAGRGRAPKPS